MICYPAPCGTSSQQVARGKDVMIAGHGAFGVENIRTCCEFSAKRIYLVCRRSLSDRETRLKQL